MSFFTQNPHHIEAFKSYFGSENKLKEVNTARGDDTRFVNIASSYPMPLMDSDNFIKSYLCPLTDGSTFCAYIAPMEEIHLGYKV